MYEHTKNSRRILLAVFALILGLHACKQRADTNPGGTLSFAILDTKKSLLNTIIKTRGRLPVCVGFIGAEDHEKENAEKWFTDAIIRAANSWNSLLHDHPEWPVKHKLTLDFQIKHEQCSPQPNGFGVNVWFKASDFERDYCSKYPICSSVTKVEEKLILIAPVNRSKPKNIYNYFTVLHEYGHLLALGDTYRNEGMSDWLEDQPPSVMNGENFPRDSFTQDDRWGLWAVFWAVKTGQRSCAGYGSEVNMTLNAWSALLCDPRTESTYRHKSIENLVELPDAPSDSGTDSIIRPGIWSYDGFDIDRTAMLIKGLDENETNLTFQSFGLNDGKTSSQTGTRYNCPKSTTKRDLTCTANVATDYRMEFKSPTNGMLFTPDYKNGIKIRFEN